MKRLYYLTKNLDSTEQISNDLHDAGITDWNFHVYSKNEKGLFKRQIHSANIIQKTDIVHSVEKSVLVGLGVGLLAALVLSQIPIHGTLPSFGILLGIFIAGILLGAWHGTLFGVQNENIKLRPFHDKITQGYYLIMVDVSAKQVEQVKELMRKNHPEAQFCSEDRTFVTPFEEPKQVSF
jgi:hypothetical protein